MSLVDVSLGLTIGIPGQDFGVIKPSVTLRIDPEGDVEGQIKSQLETAVTAWARIDGTLEQVLIDLLASNNTELSLSDRLHELELNTSENRETLNRVVAKLNEQATADAIKEAVSD